jgi:hypothetical protein
MGGQDADSRAFFFLPLSRLFFLFLVLVSLLLVLVEPSKEEHQRVQNVTRLPYGLSTVCRLG